MSVITRARPHGCFASLANSPASTKAHLIASAEARWHSPMGSRPQLVVDARCGERIGWVSGVRTHMEIPDTHYLCDKCVFADGDFLPPWTLYRFFDAADDLLYIGKTSDFLMRVRDHYLKSSWWPRVQRWLLEPHDSHQGVIDAEIRAIQTERPRFNRQHVPT